MSSWCVAGHCTYAGLLVRQRGPLRRLLPQRAFRASCPVTRRGTKHFTVRAEQDVNDKLRGAVRSGDRMAESAASLIPASVPRPAAKLAVLGVGGLIAFWLLQKVLSTAFFFLALGGAAYLWVKLSSGGGSNGGGSSGRGSDPLSEASRIMDKYK